MSETMVTILALPADKVAPAGPDHTTAHRSASASPAWAASFLRGKTWWACYYVNGTEHRESARQPAEGFHDGSLADAKRLLRKRVGEIQSQQYVAPDAKRLTFEDLRDGALNDYTRKGLRSRATGSVSLPEPGRVLWQAADPADYHCTPDRLPGLAPRRGRHERHHRSGAHCPTSGFRARSQGEPPQRGHDSRVS